MSGLQRSGHFTSDFKLLPQVTSLEAGIRVQAASSLEPQKAECNFPLLFYMCSNTLLTPVNRLSCVNLVEFPFKFFFFFSKRSQGTISNYINQKCNHILPSDFCTFHITAYCLKNNLWSVLPTVHYSRL